MTLGVLPRAALAAALVIACARPDPLAPPELRYGLDECSHCRMIVSEERHAAVARTAAGEDLRFDDPGCLVAWAREPANELDRAWVHDDPQGPWVDARGAWYVRDPRTPTPMGSGLLAFARREDARRHAATRGIDRVASWRETLARSSDG